MPLFPSRYQDYDGQYFLPIEIIPTTLVANTTYWSMRNLGTKRVFINSIKLKTGFSGIVAATRSIYNIARISAATPTAGTALTVGKKDNTFPTSSVTDARFAPGGLTTTGITFEGSNLFLSPHTNQLNIDAYQSMDFEADTNEDSLIVLAVNEGLCIRAYTAVVLGSYLVGHITWKERL